MRWDFRRYLGLSLDRLGRDFSYGEARDLISELVRESGSHLVADMAGFDFAASQADVATILHAEWYANMPRPYLKKLKKRIELWRPMGKPKANADVSAEDRARLVAELERRSVFNR